MDEAFEDIRFLTGSTNRFTALSIIVSGATTRTELESGVDASKVTLRRILKELENRGWIEHDESTYTSTETGETIAVGFTELHDTVQATYRLDGVQEWLPIEELGFDLGRLADARVTLPEDDHVITPLARMDILVGEASTSRILSPGVSISTVSANRDAVVENGQEMELILTEDVVSTITQRSDLSTMMSEMLETGRVEAYSIPNDVPLMTLVILEDVVVLGLIGKGLPMGVVESTDESVRHWADEFFEEQRDQATKLETTDFSSH